MKNLILVCESYKPKQVNVGCCGNKMPEKIIESCRNILQEKGIEAEVRGVPCLNNCAQGVSVKIFPTNTLYGNIDEISIAEIINQHIIGGEIAKDFQVKKPNFLD